MGAGITKESLTNLAGHIPVIGGYHCAMIGLDLAGKTTTLYRLKLNQYVNTAPTIGFNCEKFRFDGHLFTIWDVGGQEKLRPLWRSYTRCTDGIIFVVDSTKEDRMEEAKLELLKIHKSCSGPASKAGGGLNPVPVLVLANKQDLPNSLDSDKVEHLLGLKDLGVEGVSWHLQPTCAVTGEGLEEGFIQLHQMIVCRKRAGKNRQISSSSSPHGKLSQQQHAKTSRLVRRSNSQHF